MLTLRAAKGPDYYERPEFARDDYLRDANTLFIRANLEDRGC